MKRFGSLVLAFTALACGSAEEEGGFLVSSQTNPSGNSMILKAFSPFYKAYNFNPSAPGMLVEVNRQIPLYMFEALVEPQLSYDQLQALSVVTGLGIKANDNEGDNVEVRLGIFAREFDTVTGMFKNEVRLFAPPNTDFENSQQFYIVNTENPNFVFTGLGMKAEQGNIQKMVVQRKAMNSLHLPSSTVMPNDVTSIVLPPNWVAVGFILKLVPNETIDPFPYLSDVILYTAQWMEDPQ